MDIELLDMANSKRTEEQMENVETGGPHLAIGPSETQQGANAV